MKRILSFIRKAIRFAFRFIRRRILKPLKAAIKRILPKWLLESIRKFKDWCRMVYRNHTTFYFELMLKFRLNPKYKRTIRGKLQQTATAIVNIERVRDPQLKPRIVFLCQFTAAWNAMMSTFRAAVADPGVEVILLALPDKKARKGIEEQVADTFRGDDFGENTAYTYCKSFYPDVINAYDEDKQEWLDLKALHPDYVFFLRANDVYLPPEYRCSVVSTYAKLCFIPYAFCKMDRDSRVVYKLATMSYTYAIFTESEMYRDMLRKIFYHLLDAKWKQIECFGFPRFDLHGPVREAVKEPKAVMWLPRWVTASRLESTTFFQYKDVLIEYFKKHPDIKFICRPHPKMFINFAATGEMTEEEIAAFKKLFAETDNFMLDEYADYLPAMTEADIFISDTSSLLVEELVTGKPIIFCGNMAHFDRDAKQWSHHMYPVRNKRMLVKRLGNLLAGHDPKRENRERYVREYMKHDGKSGERIIAFLKKDYYGRMERMTGVLPTGGTISL